MLPSHPALRRLAVLKLRAYVRSVRRRLSRPSGIFFALLGLAMMGLWLASLSFRSAVAPEIDLPIDDRRAIVRGGLFLLAALSVIGSLTHRGLYLPKDEIERLFSSPLTRSDLVRYRMWSNLGRSLLFGIIMGLLVAPRMPSRTFAFFGAFVAVLTLPIVGQAAALAFGDAENRLGRLMKRVPVSAMRIATGVAAWAFVMMLVFGEDLLGESFMGGEDGEPSLSRILGHPAYVVLTAPFGVWANAIAATNLVEFVPWFLAAVVAWGALFEATARIPIDFRTLSLETSADVARRLSRMRSGRNLISGGKVSKRALGWKVPWLFGRGPFGAVAWLKLCSIVRKSRGTLLFATVVIGFVTFLTSMESTGPMRDSIAGPALVAVLGTIYLSAGLRFDFRSDLDLMETIKAWPLSAPRLFLATILPEVVLVTSLIGAAVLLRAAILSSFPAYLWPVLGAVPFIALIWTALDNAVFLFAPVRFVPGQGGAMHHTGRAMVLVFLRMVLLFVIAAVVGLAVFLTVLAADWLGVTGASRVGLALGAGGLVLLVFAYVVVQVGGWTFVRYDVSKETGLT